MNLSLLRPIVDALRDHGTDPETVLSSVGLSTEAVASDDAAVHVLVIHQFLEACAEATEDRCFCARVGSRMSPEGWPMIRSAMQSARTFGDFLNIYITGARAVSSSVTPYLEVRGTSAVFGETRRFTPPIAPAQNDGFMVSLSLSLIEHVLRDRADPAQMFLVVVDPNALPPSRFRRYQVLRGDRMGFRIQFPSDWLTLSLGEARDPRPAERPAAQDFLASFRQLLRQHVGLGGLNAEQSATLVAMSRPQLARRLTSLGTTISREITNARIEYAQSELRATDTSIELIASRLGYTDPSNFARMFGRETGLTPTQYRVSQIDRGNA